VVLTAAGQATAGLRDGRGRHWQKHNELKKSDAMQAILRPVSHPQLGDLVIKDALFSIGRDIDAFARMPPALTARLSRRHARLFEQDIALVETGDVSRGRIFSHPHSRLQRVPLVTGEGAYQVDHAGQPVQLHLHVASQ